MYEDKSTASYGDEFWNFNNVFACSHEQIYIKWITNLNNNFAMLSFVCHGDQIHAEYKVVLIGREV